MDIGKVIKRCFACMLVLNISIVSFAQNLETLKEKIEIKKNVVSKEAIKLVYIFNKNDCEIKLKLRYAGDYNGAKEQDVILKKDEKKHYGEDFIEIKSIRLLGPNGNSKTIWAPGNTAEEWNKRQSTNEKSTTENAGKTETTSDDKPATKKELKKTETPKPEVKRTDAKAIVASFVEQLDNEKSFLSQASIDEILKEVNRHIVHMKKEHRKEYLAIHLDDLNTYVQETGQKIDKVKADCDTIIAEYLSKYKGYKIDETFNYRDSINCILNSRIESIDTLIDSLRTTINSNEESEILNFADIETKKLVNIAVVVFIAVILCIWLGILSKKRKNKRQQNNSAPVPTIENSPSIVVKKTTTTVLKKQNLDDVVDNNAYLKLACSDFCDDSAVRFMYIKNTCIKDIYNMYADDLRNPNNPKEDGCMVLGRWVYNETTNEYDVSLEEIISPGEDAVFQEYELNFGGKIKLKMTERLRKLRRDTDLQYDLTCWVHSHPGLGVFFSNSDSRVQSQLKHPIHPNFLTAIVVDILTPSQETGIFTFKHDSSMNSKSELKKMYSLEELHKWAVESDRNSYKADDYYNVLSKVKNVNEECQTIQLSNGAIIDISSIANENVVGVAGWMHGFKTTSRGKNEIVINAVAKNHYLVDNELLGCLIVGNHCSIPSIRRVISEYANKIKFVMFYSVKDEIITTIPVIDMQLSMDEKFYAEEKLEDLKIWTRRKR